MSVLAIIAALVIEQWRPLGDRKALQGTLAAWASWLEQSFNGGERRHGTVAWLVAVLPPVLLAAGVPAGVFFVARLIAPAFYIFVLFFSPRFPPVSPQLPHIPTAP